MRLAIVSIALASSLVSGLAATAAFGTAQDEPQQKRPLGIPGFRQAESERLAEEIVGSWTLLEYRNRHEVLTRRDYAGFASFQNGFFTFLLRLDVTEDGLLGPRPETIVQAGVHRYRLVDDRLQTATVMGFSNENDDFQLQAEPSSFPREFQVTLADQRLSLRRWDGLELVFARSDATDAFPKKAAEALERNRGRNFSVPPDWDRRR